MVASWAESEPLVNRAYLFGSRLKGTHNAESDLDVAVELLPTRGDSSPFTTWTSEAARLRADVAARLPVNVDLQWYGNECTTPTIHAGILAGARLVFDRIA